MKKLLFKFRFAIAILLLVPVITLVVVNQVKQKRIDRSKTTTAPQFNNPNLNDSTADLLDWLK